MAATLESLKALTAWEEYHPFMKERLKQLPDGETPFYLSKEKLAFDQDGKPWKGYAVLIGPKAEIAVRKIKKDGVLFREGTCTVKGKVITVRGIAAQLLKHAQKTFKQLKLGYKVGGLGDEAEEATPDTSALQKRLAKLIDDIKKASVLTEPATEGFIKEATDLAKLAAGALATDPDQAFEWIREAEEFTAQARVGILEGGKDTEAKTLEIRRQELLAELKSAQALKDPANDMTLALAAQVAKEALEAIGKKEYVAAAEDLDELEGMLAEVVEGPEPAPGADPDLAGLSDWKAYREFLKVNLKKLGRESSPIYVSRKKVEFVIDGKPFPFFAVLVGKKGLITVNILKKEGVLFKEGIVRPEGKKLLVSAIQSELVKGAQKLFLKLRLGRKVVPDGELPPDEGETAEDAADDPTGNRALDREIKEVAENLIKLRDAIEDQKKLSARQVTDAIAKKQEAKTLKKAADDLRAAGKPDAEVRAAQDAADKALTDSGNMEIESKDFAVLTKRWGDELRELTEKLNRIKNSTASTPDKRAQVKKLKAEVVGKLLDAKVANLDPADPNTGKVIAKQIKARFGTTFKLYESVPDGVDADGNIKYKEYKQKLDPKKEADTLKQLYLTMSKCPNFPKSKLNKVDVSLRPADARGEGGVYYEDKKKAAINCRRPKDSFEYDVSNSAHFPDGVDENCKPANNDPVKYFNWATLHEVAHAVDAKHKFMDSKGSQPKYGKWTEYRGSHGPIAAAVAQHYGAGLGADDLKALQAYAKAVIDGGRPAAARSPEETAKRADVDAWRADMGVKNGPWWEGAATKNRAIGGVVYQEAYDGWWVSYDLAARKQGIHGYQFRAPGEWFAELYAAYYSDKLKSSHPFVPELAKLEVPK